MRYAGVLTVCFGLFVAAGVYAQQKSDCDAFLKRDLSKDTPEQALQKIRESKCFDLDSIDLQIFGKGPLLGAIIFKIVKKSHSSPLTYGELLVEINKNKADPRYAKVRMLIIAQNALEKMEATPATWNKALPLLKTIETPPDEIFNLHEFMLKNVKKALNYHQLIILFEIEEGKGKA